MTNEIRQEERDKLLGVESEKNELQIQLDSKKNQEDTIKKNIFWSVDKRIRIEARIFSALVAILVLLIAILSTIKLDIPNIIIQRASYCLSILLSMSSYFITIKESNLRTLYYEKKFEKRLASEYRRIGLPENE